MMENLGGALDVAPEERWTAPVETVADDVAAEWGG